MNAQIWYVVLLSVTVIAALIGTSIVLGQSKNGPGEDHYIDLDPQMQGEPYATPVIVGDDGVTRQKDIVHDIKQMPDDTAIVDVLYAGSKKGSKDDTKAEHMTMKKVDVRRLGLKPGTTVTLHKNMPLFQWILNLPLLAVGFGIKTLFFAMKGYGREYLAGIKNGFSISYKKENHGKKVRFRWKNFGNYCRIQIELWANLFRRFY